MLYGQKSYRESRMPWSRWIWSDMVDKKLNSILAKPNSVMIPIAHPHGLRNTKGFCPNITQEPGPVSSLHKHRSLYDLSCCLNVLHVLVGCFTVVGTNTGRAIRAKLELLDLKDIADGLIKKGVDNIWE